MKRILTFVTLLLLTTFFGGLVVKAVLPAPAAGEATVVVHFHKWDDDYENVGGHSWGGKVLVDVNGTYQLLEGGVQPTGKDDFGIYFVYRFATGETAPDLGFIPVMASAWNSDGTIVQNWDKKLSADDVLIPVSEYAAGSVHHIYVFEGSKGIKADTAAGEVPFLVADPEMINLLVAFYDPNNNYHENLGVHSWSWKEGQNATGWNDPLAVFSDVAVIGTTPVKAALLSQTKELVGGAGLLIYHGDGDNSKYSGDIKSEVTPDLGIYSPDAKVGEAVPVYVLNTGAGNASNDNVFFGANLAQFGVEAFSFRFDLGNFANGAGTFAMNKRVVYTMFSLSIVTGFVSGGLDDAQKAAFKEDLISRFSIVEVVDGVETTNAVPITEINFNEYADDTKEFILSLGQDLDDTKNYRIVYQPPTPTQPVKQRTIRFEVTAPAGTPAVYVVGSINGWTPGRSNWKLTKGANDVWTLEVTAMLSPQNFEYKYVYAADWQYEEDVDGNRVLTIGEETEIVVQDTVTWKTAPVDGEVYPEEAAEFVLEDEALVEIVTPDPVKADLALDTEAPSLLFLSDFDLDENGVGIILIEQYSKWDQTLFPVFVVDDNRDGTITHRVYVPGDQEFKVLDTNKLGDYKILLRVTDEWGHVTEVVFIFRVVAKIKK
jgi:hypothetical protein